MDLKIRTPEGVEFALPLAGPVSRMLAFVVDIGVVITIGSVAKQVLGPLGFLGKDFLDAIHIMSYFVISLAYMAVAEWLWRGQTVGKRLLGLRVVDAGGFRLEPSQVIVRNLMRFVDGLPALYLVGGITCLVNRHNTLPSQCYSGGNTLATSPGPSLSTFPQRALIHSCYMTRHFHLSPTNARTQAASC